MQVCHDSSCITADRTGKNKFETIYNNYDTNYKYPCAMKFFVLWKSLDNLNLICTEEWVLVLISRCLLKQKFCIN